MADLADFYEKKMNHSKKNETNIVKTHFDPSVIHRKGKNSDTDIKGKMGLSALGAESNEKKYTKKLGLEIAIRKERVTTLQEAMEFSGYSRVTVITYLKEIGVSLKDEKTGKYVGANRNAVQPKIVYYDGDPLKNGKVIEK